MGMRVCVCVELRKECKRVQEKEREVRLKEKREKERETGYLRVASIHPHRFHTRELENTIE